MSDCVVESWDGDHAVIVTSHAAAAGDEFVMQFDSPSGGSHSCAVRVVSSVPDVENGAARFRLLVTTSPVSSDWRTSPGTGV